MIPVGDERLHLATPELHTPSAGHECAGIESARPHYGPGNGLNCWSMSRDIEVIADPGKKLCYVMSRSYAPDRAELLTPGSFKQQVGSVVLRNGKTTGSIQL